jgi:hypothetical protein
MSHGHASASSSSAKVETFKVNAKAVQRNYAVEPTLGKSMKTIARVCAACNNVVATAKKKKKKKNHFFQPVLIRFLCVMCRLSHCEWCEWPTGDFGECEAPNVF